VESVFGEDVGLTLIGEIDVAQFAQSGATEGVPERRLSNSQRHRVDLRHDRGGVDPVHTLVFVARCGIRMRASLGDDGTRARSHEQSTRQC